MVSLSSCSRVTEPAVPRMASKLLQINSKASSSARPDSHRFSCSRKRRVGQRIELRLRAAVPAFRHLHSCHAPNSMKDSAKYWVFQREEDKHTSVQAAGGEKEMEESGGREGEGGGAKSACIYVYRTCAPCQSCCWMICIEQYCGMCLVT